MPLILAICLGLETDLKTGRHCRCHVCNTRRDSTAATSVEAMEVATATSAEHTYFYFKITLIDILLKFLF